MAPPKHEVESPFKGIVAKLERELYLLFLVGGVYAFYFVYGILQEKLTRTSYEPDGERFRFTLTMIFVQCVANTLCAYVGTLLVERNTSISFVSFARVSFTYIAAMFCSNYSLNWVDYPTQVLGKSCKMIPVMVFSVLWNKKKYPLVKYFSVVTITIGISMFFLKKWPASSRDEEPTDPFGIFLIFLSLMLDGMTTGEQENIIHSLKPSAQQLMMCMNAWAAVFLGVGLVATNELGESVHFIQQHPVVLADLVYFSVCSALGQLFIYSLVKNFGPLVCTTVTTTRKFFTLLASVFYFGHAMTSMQWWGTLLVFLALSADLVQSYASKQSHTKKE
eukprot:TRINITY_DN8322_c0_g1_i1.p1 TRINITY_DN8322_c0_g1~~TRINITY_DN8322_c0_g1_i1.p1  ORF type:complete len:334 (+),score=45.63 TRINITY_DN8322_c0_g1_i1:59-1060(+)